MEAGFVMDRFDDGRRSLQHWMAGLPEYGFLGGLKTRQRQHLDVFTYRCTKCGLLESYATTESKSR